MTSAERSLKSLSPKKTTTRRCGVAAPYHRSMRRSRGSLSLSDAAVGFPFRRISALLVVVFSLVALCQARPKTTKYDPPGVHTSSSWRNEVRQGWLSRQRLRSQSGLGKTSGHDPGHTVIQVPMLLDSSRNHCAPHQRCLHLRFWRAWILSWRLCFLCGTMCAVRSKRANVSHRTCLCVSSTISEHGSLVRIVLLLTSRSETTQPIFGSVQVLQERIFLQRKKTVSRNSTGCIIHEKHSLDSHWHWGLLFGCSCGWFVRAQRRLRGKRFEETCTKKLTSDVATCGGPCGNALETRWCQKHAHIIRIRTRTWIPRICTTLCKIPLVASTQDCRVGGLEMCLPRYSSSVFSVAQAPHQRAADTFNQDCWCSWAVLSVQLAHKENMPSRAHWLNRVGVDCESVSRVIRNCQASHVFWKRISKNKSLVNTLHSDHSQPQRLQTQIRTSNKVRQWLNWLIRADDKGGAHASWQEQDNTLELDSQKRHDNAVAPCTEVFLLFLTKRALFHRI